MRSPYVTSAGSVVLRLDDDRGGHPSARLIDLHTADDRRRAKVNREPHVARGIEHRRRRRHSRGACTRIRCAQPCAAHVEERLGARMPIEGVAHRAPLDACALRGQPVAHVPRVEIIERARHVMRWRCGDGRGGCARGAGEEADGVHVPLPGGVESVTRCAEPHAGGYDARKRRRGRRWPRRLRRRWRQRWGQKWWLHGWRCGRRGR